MESAPLLQNFLLSNDATMTDLGKLGRIQIEGYKSIRSLDMTMRGLNVLIGPNGSGKSNFVSFFKFVNKIIEKDLQVHIAQQGGSDKFLYFGEKTTKSLSFHIEFRPNAYGCKLVPTRQGGLVFEEEYCEFFAVKVGYSGGTKRYELAHAGDSESRLPSRASSASISGWVVSYLKDWKVYHFNDTSESSQIKKSASIFDNRMLRPDASNLAAYLHSIQDSQEYNLIVKTIRRVAPFFQDFVLEPDKASPESVRLRWKHVGTDDYFDANDLSDGTLRFICLATLLLQPDLPKTILLDEPELGLHPFATQLLASMMRSVSARTQIIASTQSVTLANQFSWEDLIIVDRVDNASVFRRLTESEVMNWLDEFSVGDLWEKNLIGGTP